MLDRMTGWAQPSGQHSGRRPRATPSTQSAPRGGRRQASGSVQVLDLGVTEAATYLIPTTPLRQILDWSWPLTHPMLNRSSQTPWAVEVFGQARSHEPEPYDDEENVDAGYINSSR